MTTTMGEYKKKKVYSAYKEKPQLSKENDKEGIKEKLSTMSFEDLQTLKAEMGTKLYIKTIFGDKKIKISKAQFNRANKNRPREISSKKKCLQDVNLRKQVFRDPRFDAMCGTFDQKRFKNNYKFVDDLRKKEKRQLEDALCYTNDKEEKKKIKFVIQRLNNQINEGAEQRNRMQELDRGLKSSQKSQTRKKSVKKLESLIDKFEELKKKDKLKKHIEKKTKKVSAKEHKNLGSYA